jgi:DNA-binding NarL/FixJ family response regulator
MKNREIAESLHVTEHTVSNFLYRVFEKLGVGPDRIILEAPSNELRSTDHVRRAHLGATL